MTNLPRLTEVFFARLHLVTVKPLRGTLIGNGHLQFRIKEETGEGIVLLGISPAFNNQKYYNTYINTGANNFNIEFQYLRI